MVVDINSALTERGYRTGSHVVGSVHHLDLPHPVKWVEPGGFHIGSFQDSLRGGRITQVFIHMAVAAGERPAELVDGAHGGPVEKVTAPPAYLAATRVVTVGRIHGLEASTVFFVTLVGIEISDVFSGRFITFTY